MPALQIVLPANFTPKHEKVVIEYLAGQLAGKEAWRLAFTAFDLLDEAILHLPDGSQTFRTLYRQLIDDEIADQYLHELLTLQDVEKGSPALWARFARQIMTEFVQRGWQRTDIPETRLLLSYFLYWWGAFARGYALEVEIFQDLQQSGVQFQAHNLLDHQERYSPSDLIIRGLAGDIKTSVYFVQAAISLTQDFYIVRLSLRGRTYTLVVLLQPLAWDAINGDTVDGTLETIQQQSSTPIRIRQAGHVLVALAYTEWKRRMLALQGEDK